MKLRWVELGSRLKESIKINEIKWGWAELIKLQKSNWNWCMFHLIPNNWNISLAKQLCYLNHEKYMNFPNMMMNKEEIDIYFDRRHIKNHFIFSEFEFILVHLLSLIVCTFYKHFQKLLELLIWLHCLSYNLF